MTVEKFLYEWYEYAKQKDPHHFTEYDEGDSTFLEVTFEQFRTTPLVERTIKALWKQLQ